MAMSWIVSIFSCNKLSSFHQSLNKAEQMVHFFCTEGNNKFSFQNRKLQSLFSAESAICLLHFGKLMLWNPGFRHKFMFHKSLNSTSHGGIERRWKFTSSIWFWKTPFFLRLEMLVMSTHLKLGHLSQELVYMGQSENTGDCWYQFWIHFFDVTTIWCLVRLTPGRVVLEEPTIAIEDGLLQLFHIPNLRREWIQYF